MDWVNLTQSIRRVFLMICLNFEWLPTNLWFIAAVPNYEKGVRFKQESYSFNSSFSIIFAKSLM